MAEEKKLACIYNSGNYFELKQSTIDNNMILVYFNQKFIGAVSYFQVYKLATAFLELTPPP